MIIAIAGPYSANTENQRKINLSRLNDVAVKILEKGHIPVIGVNAALPVVEKINNSNQREIIMKISMAVMKACDAILVIAESPGANQEKEYFKAKGFPVFHSLEEIPEIN